jgi:hypothetical protein
VALVHYQDAKQVNLSTYLSADLQQDYSALSNLFSENEGMTIEHYFIAQRLKE